VERRLTIADYLGGEETTRPQELAYGFLREPPAPGFGHQEIVGRLYVRLEAHVRAEKRGRVVLSPVDVILDPVRALVVQPDLAFVAAARLNICSDRIWGAPDLVVEVLSTHTRRHDRSTKLRWYRQYGVAECWIVDPVARSIEVHSATTSAPAVFEDERLVRSGVLPSLALAAADAFAG
jgi:Uma2 family endonuclease